MITKQKRITRRRRRQRKKNKDTEREDDKVEELEDEKRRDENRVEERSRKRRRGGKECKSRIEKEDMRKETVGRMWLRSSRIITVRRRRLKERRRKG